MAYTGTVACRQVSQPSALPWPLVLATSLSSFLPPFLGSSLNVALPSLAREFHLDLVTLSWLATAFLATSVGALIPFGRLADLWGRRRLLLAGMTAQALFSAAAGFAPSWSWLLALRAAQGVAAACGFATAVALLAARTPPARRGSLLGINTAAVYLGLTLGPPLGGFITQHWGWRWIFLLTAALALASALALLAAPLRETPSFRSFPWPRAMFFFLGVCSMVAALLMARLQLPFLALAAVAALVVGASLAGKEGKNLAATFLFAHRGFAMANGAALLHYAATFSVGFLLSLLLQLLGGWSPAQTGALLLLQPAAMTVLSPAAGFLSDRWEPRWVASAGMALTGLALALLTQLSAATARVWLAVCLLLLGVGFALFSSPNTNAVMAQADQEHLGSASAILASMRLLGQTTSLLLAAFLLPRHGPQVTDATNLLASLNRAFALSALLCLAGLPLSLARGRLHRPVPPAVAENNTAR